jgi:hypothetical protein
MLKRVAVPNQSSHGKMPGGEGRVWQDLKLWTEQPTKLKLQYQLQQPTSFHNTKYRENYRESQPHTATTNFCFVVPTLVCTFVLKYISSTTSSSSSISSVLVCTCMYTLELFNFNICFVSTTCSAYIRLYCVAHKHCHPGCWHWAACFVINHAFSCYAHPMFRAPSGV